MRRKEAQERWYRVNGGKSTEGTEKSRFDDGIRFVIMLTLGKRRLDRRTPKWVRVGADFAEFGRRLWEYEGFVVVEIQVA
jgi:hypothetical protein